MHVDFIWEISCRHFGLNWAFVDPKTPVQQGVKFCVCVKEFLPWLMMPLQVVYVDETSTAKNRVASFGFGSGTLHGHLLVSVLSPFCTANTLTSVSFTVFHYHRSQYSFGVRELMFAYILWSLDNDI